VAEHSKAHLWTNTFIALCALGVSGLSSLFSYWSYSLKGEAISFEANFTTQCPLDVKIKDAKRPKILDDGYITLCWHVVVSNRSDSRTTVIRYDTEETKSDHLTVFGLRAIVDDADGQPAQIPKVFESGEARSYLLRIQVQYAPELAATYQALLARPNSATLTLSDAQEAACNAGFDLVGNHLNGNCYNWFGYTTAEPITSVRFRIWTGRGNSFALKLEYPLYYMLDWKLSK
jgi:hypothetical protein